MKIKSIISLIMMALMSVAFAAESFAIPLSSYSYPGAQAGDRAYVPYKTLKPGTSSAAADGPEYTKEKGCHASSSSSTVKICTYGKKTGYQYTVFLVGDSHSAHWFGSIDALSEKYKIRILTATKTACSFTTRPYGKAYPTCDAYNKKLAPMIAKYKPDVVFTKANKTNDPTAITGIIGRFEELRQQNIKVFAVRDTMYFDQNQPACVKEFGRRAAKCSIKTDVALPLVSDWDKQAYKPSNVKYVDYSRKVCDNTYCYPTKGNVMLVRDSHHMTDSYARTLSPYFEKDLIPFLKKAKAERILMGA